MKQKSDHYALECQIGKEKGMGWEHTSGKAILHHKFHVLSAIL